MKHLLILLALGILNSCNSNSSDLSSGITAEASNCPDVPNELPYINIDSLEDGFYNTFNYQIENIVTNKDTIAASSFDYKFTLCRANNGWIVESRSNDADGDRLVRGSEPDKDYIFDHNALRGDLELLELTENTTKVKYYSAWVKDSLLQPYLT